MSDCKSWTWSRVKSTQDFSEYEKQSVRPCAIVLRLGPLDERQPHCQQRRQGEEKATASKIGVYRPHLERIRSRQAENAGEKHKSCVQGSSTPAMVVIGFLPTNRVGCPFQKSNVGANQPYSTLERTLMNITTSSNPACANRCIDHVCNRMVTEPYFLLLLQTVVVLVGRLDKAA